MRILFFIFNIVPFHDDDDDDDDDDYVYYYDHFEEHIFLFFVSFRSPSVGGSDVATPSTLCLHFKPTSPILYLMRVISGRKPQKEREWSRRAKYQLRKARKV